MGGKQDPIVHREIHAEDSVHPWDGFRQRPELATHQRLPLGRCGTPHHCIDCSKRFRNPFALNQHQCIHIKEQPYHCADCGRSFTRSSSLRIYRCMHTGERLYRCADCRISGLRRHQRTHTREWLYHCTHCGKGFAESSSPIIHQRMHTRERLYCCDDYGKGFARILDLH